MVHPQNFYPKRSTPHPQRSQHLSHQGLFGCTMALGTSPTEAPEAPTPPGEAAPPMVATPPTPMWLQNPWTGTVKLVRVPEPDKSLWNPSRIAGYEHAISQEGAPPLAMLSIERLGMVTEQVENL